MAVVDVVETAVVQLLERPQRQGRVVAVGCRRQDTLVAERVGPQGRDDRRGQGADGSGEVHQPSSLFNTFVMSSSVSEPIFSKTSLTAGAASLAAPDISITAS